MSPRNRASKVEYSIIALLISLAVLAMIPALRHSVSNSYDVVSEALPDGASFRTVSAK